MVVAAVIEDEAEVENVQVVRGVICVITVIKTVIMLKIVQNHLKRGSHDYKMADALFVTKKDIKKLIVQIDVEVVAVENIGEAEVHRQEEVEALEVDLEVVLVLGEIGLEDKSKLFFYIFLKF